MEQITTICYGKKDTWQVRKEASRRDMRPYIHNFV